MGSVKVEDEILGDWEISKSSGGQWEGGKFIGKQTTGCESGTRHHQTRFDGESILIVIRDTAAEGMPVKQQNRSEVDFVSVSQGA